MSDEELSKKRKRRSDSFKLMAVKRVRNGEKIVDVADHLKIAKSTLSDWVQKSKSQTNNDRTDRIENSDFTSNEEVQDSVHQQTLINNRPEGDIPTECADKKQGYISKESTSTNEGKKNNSLLTESMPYRTEFTYPEGFKNTNKLRKNLTNSQEDLIANGLNKKCSHNQHFKETEQRMRPQGQKTYATSNASRVNNWIDQAGKKLRENLKKLHDKGQTEHFDKETENDLKQSYYNATSNEQCGVLKSSCSSVGIVKTSEIYDRQRTDDLPSGDIQENKEEMKASEENAYTCAVTNGAQPENDSSVHKLIFPNKSAKSECTSGRKRSEHRPEKKKEAMERRRGGEKTASVAKDLDIPDSTIRDWMRKEKMKGENPQDNECIPSLKWGKWIEIMSAENHGKGWAERDKGYRLEKLGQHFKDKYGLFELAVCKPSEKSVKAENIVYVKDGRILTLLERHCKYGFQKSILISTKMREMYSIKARCCYVTTEKEALEQKIKLLQEADYPWNKQCRDGVADERVSGNWDGWILIMSPDCIPLPVNAWIRRDGYGYRYKPLETMLKDEFGIFEMVISKQNTQEYSVVLLECGKILTSIRMYCSSSAKSAQINDILTKGYDVLVRCCYAKEKEAQIAKSRLLEKYVYNWLKKRTRREHITDGQVMGSWTEWKLIMVPDLTVAPDQAHLFVRRQDGNIGYRNNNIEDIFQDQYGFFELQIARGNDNQVTYVQYGKLLTLLQRYCSNGYKRSVVINRALDEGYSISVRYRYVNTDYGKENASTFLRQLLSLYDYAWNKTRREDIDDEIIEGNWSDWVSVMTSHIQQGWTQRDNGDARKGYHPNNFAKLFEEKYGIFEIQAGYHPRSANSGTCGEKIVDQLDTVVYIGKGSILTEVKKRCCNKSKQSLLIDQALKAGKCISVRYCYTENDTLEEADDLQRPLLDRYDYAWIRSKREDVYDNNLPGKWSEWSKIMKPGEVEKDWEWRDEKFIGFKVKNLDGIFTDDYGVFEMGVEKPDRDIAVHVGKGRVLSEIKKYCKINTDGSYKFNQVSDALAKRCSILARFRVVDSDEDATKLEQNLVDRYEYPWNPLYRTKREEVDDSCLPGQHWSEWHHLMTSHGNTSDWIRRDPEHTGFRLTDEILKKSIVENERGVYELGITKHRSIIVVYAGKAENLLQRLAEYCKNGSHKQKHFDDALLYSYNIWARFRLTTNIDDAENKLLDRYNYAWNKSRNDQERDIMRKET